MKRTIAVIICALIAAALLLPANVDMAQADEGVSPTALSSTVINLNKTTKYYAFDGPFSISYADKLYVHTNSGTYECGDDIIKSEDADAYVMVSGVKVALKNGQIDGDAAKSGYIKLSAYGERLYAIKENGQIDLYSFVFDEDGISSLQLSESYPVSALDVAADENGFNYLKKINRTQYAIILATGESVTCSRIIQSIVATEKSVYAMTKAGIYIYDKYDIYSAPQEIECDPLAITVSDKVYVLLYDQSISVVNGLSVNPIIASSGNADYFFEAPCKGTTRLGKMYVCDSMLGRVAVYDKNGITYKQNLNGASCVAADNDGKFYVAYNGNKIACFDGNTRTEVPNPSGEKIIDLEAGDKLYYLTENGNVYQDDKKIASGVTALDYCSSLVTLKNGIIEGTNIEADDFCLDIVGNIFAVKDNILTVIKGDETVTYTVDGALSLDSIMLSKIETPFVSYGDLIISDKQNMRILRVSRSDVGGADIKKLYTVQEIDDKPLRKSNNLISVTTSASYLFTYPVESEITYSFAKGETAFVCYDVVSPGAYVYCVIENKATGKFSQGFAYASSVATKNYTDPLKKEAKINSDNTSVYKFPSLYSPVTGKLNKGDMASILPFATNYEDEYGERWFTDVNNNKWYRIDRGEYEGYILASSANVNLFSDTEMPKANATVTDNTVLYMYADGEYVPFDGAGLYIAKGTRVKIETPFDTSRKYTKVVFYRDGYGTIDVDCYVLTKYIDYDGVDLVKIIAVSVVAIAAIILLAVLMRKKKAS